MVRWYTTNLPTYILGHQDLGTYLLERSNKYGVNHIIFLCFLHSVHREDQSMLAASQQMIIY